MKEFNIEEAKKKGVKIVTRLGYPVQIITFDNGTYGALQPEFDTIITAKVFVSTDETVEKEYTKYGKICDRYDSDWDLFIDDGLDNGFEITPVEKNHRYWSLVLNDYKYVDRYCNGDRYKHFRTLDLLLKFVNDYHLQNKILAILPVNTEQTIEEFVEEVVRI